MVELFTMEYMTVLGMTMVLLFLALSRFRGWRLVFQLRSVILFCMLIQHAAGLATICRAGI